MKKYLVIEKRGEPYLDYIGLPVNLDARQTKDEIIRRLIFYINNPSSYHEQIKKLKKNTPYAIIQNGEFKNIKEYINSIYRKRLF